VARQVGVSVMEGSNHRVIGGLAALAVRSGKARTVDDPRLSVLAETS
jgi:hypothetical protein